MAILYTIDCPACKILEKKLRDKRIDFTIVNDREILKEKGFVQLPVLSIDGVIMNFKEAVAWVNGQ